MTAEDEVALEADQQVLADRVDRLEQTPVEPLGKPLAGSSRVRRLHLHALTDEHLQPRGGPVERVGFGHAGSVVRGRTSGMPTIAA